MDRDYLYDPQRVELWRICDATDYAFETPEAVARAWSQRHIREFSELNQIISQEIDEATDT